VLALYSDPDRLVTRLPVLRYLTRPFDEIRAAAERLQIALAAVLDGVATVRVLECQSQIGSGALPTRTIRSAGIAIAPHARRGAGRSVHAIAAAFRRLPVPVIGRIQDDTFVLDVRCLDDESVFLAQVSRLDGISERVTAQ